MLRSCAVLRNMFDNLSQLSWSNSDILDFVAARKTGDGVSPVLHHMHARHWVVPGHQPRCFAVVHRRLSRDASGETAETALQTSTAR